MSARILIVEDEGIVAEDIRLTLETLGYAVPDCLPSGEEAVERIAALEPDLVLMDIHLKGEMDGIEAAQRIQEEWGLPVIYLTAFADDEILQQARLTQPFGYLLKPFKERELHATIEMALYRHQMEKELEAKEAQLHQSQKMEAIGQLAAGVAHDFNNLITIISGYSQLLMKMLDPEDPKRASVEEIDGAAQRAAGLVNQLLAFSRRQPTEPKRLDLNEMVTGVEKMLRRLIGESIELVVQLAPEAMGVHADPVQVEQVLINLAVNARDAMPQGGRLTFETARVDLDPPFVESRPGMRPGAHVVLTVRDTGIGMDEPTRSRLFEPFFTTKEVGKGTGLGLSTVYGIVQQANGHIQVHSQPGKGSTFQVYLPYHREAADAGKKAPSLSPTTQNRETILLVEDEDATRRTLFHLLYKNGFTVLEARDGAEAWEVYTRYEQPIHLVLTDVVMPRMDGFQLAEEVRALCPETRVLFMSGYTEHTLADYGKLALNGECLFKPFTMEVLVRKVREVLDGRMGDGRMGDGESPSARPPEEQGAGRAGKTLQSQEELGSDAR